MAREKTGPNGKNYSKYLSAGIREKLIYNRGLVERGKFLMSEIKAKKYLIQELEEKERQLNQIIKMKERYAKKIK